MPRALYCAFAPPKTSWRSALRTDRQGHFVAEHQRRGRPHRGRRLSVTGHHRVRQPRQQRPDQRRCRAPISAALGGVLRCRRPWRRIHNLRRRTRAASPAMCDHRRVRVRNILIGLLAAAGFAAILRLTGGPAKPRDAPPCAAAPRRRRRPPSAAAAPAGPEATPEPGEISVLSLLRRDDRSRPPGAAAGGARSRRARRPAPTGARAGPRTASRGSPTTTS